MSHSTLVQYRRDRFASAIFALSTFQRGDVPYMDVINDSPITLGDCNRALAYLYGVTLTLENQIKKGDPK